MFMSDPKIVIDSIVNQEGQVTDTNQIRIYPITITRYAYLELLNSPFLNPEIKFGVSTVIPSAFVFCSESEVLRKYTSRDMDKLTQDAFAWADAKLKPQDVPELIKNITDQMMALNQSAPNGSGQKQDDVKKNPR